MHFYQAPALDSNQENMAPVQLQQVAALPHRTDAIEGLPYGFRAELPASPSASPLPFNHLQKIADSINPMPQPNLQSFRLEEGNQQLLPDRDSLA